MARMSKRELKKYIKTLKRAKLEEQVFELYDKFKPVKTYYDFVFNPKEDRLIEEAKIKIYKEYFPNTKRRAKKRRSTAQKIIKSFLVLGVNESLIADVMLYNIEIAQSYTAEIRINQDSFYTSIFNSFEQAIIFIKEQGLSSDFELRITNVLDAVEAQNWINEAAFFRVKDSL
ncbi:MAG: hypothetical protein ACI8XB_001397 [Patiriisocius sp.]